MARIAFFILHGVGSLNAGLQLANDLQARGHQITYIGLADSQDAIRANGFAFVTLFERYFPKGSIPELGRQSTMLHGLHYLRSQYRKYRLFAGFIDHLISGGDEEFFTAIDELQPDIVIYCGARFVEWAALMAVARGVKGVYFCSSLSLRGGTGLPPITSPIIPRYDGSAWQAARIWLAWKKFDLKSRIHFFGYAGLTKRLAAKYGYARLRRSTHDISVPLPEIVSFPPDFDFPSPGLPDRRYIGASVCLSRREMEFPWHRLDGDRPLVYCALGTCLWHEKNEYLRFFRTVMEAATATPGWRWVLTTGDALDLSELGPAPENVLVVRSAPQIGLLKRASVMITHGGANTVKECILLGVPMVIFPLGGDHHGIAARAVYHGLAIRGEFAKVDGPELRSLVETARSDPYLHVQFRLMQARFVEMEAAKAGATLIESILSVDSDHCIESAPRMPDVSPPTA
jgi:zeaxanthin glucosyltransferase